MISVAISYFKHETEFRTQDYFLWPNSKTICKQSDFDINHLQNSVQVPTNTHTLYIQNMFNMWDHLIDHNEDEGTVHQFPFDALKSITWALQSHTDG